MGSFSRGAAVRWEDGRRRLAREGTSYGAISTGEAGRSFAQDVGVATAAGASRSFGSG